MKMKKSPVKITIYQKGYTKDEFEKLIELYGKDNVKIIPEAKEECKR